MNQVHIACAAAAALANAFVFINDSHAADNCPGLDYAVTLVTQAQQQRQPLQLDNGLQVVLLPDANATTAAVVTTLAVGAAHEKRGETGYAHLFEHLMFRGSATLPDGAYADLIARVGGHYNAETGYDYTSYYATVPAEALPQLLWQEAQRFQAPLLTDSTVQSEVATVLEETALRVDNVPFVRSAMEELFQRWQHPTYNHSVLGSITDLKAATPASLTRFFQQFYRPENITLVVSGRFDPAQVRAQIERDWAGWQRSDTALTLPDLPAHPEASFEAELVDSRSPWPALVAIWQTVPEIHPDAAAVSLLQHWLFYGEQGVVRQQLMAQQSLLQSQEMPLDLPRIGLKVLVLVPRAAISLDRLQQQLDATLRHAATSIPAGDALCELKTALAKRHILKLEQPIALAYRESVDLALWQQSRLLTELRQLQAVTPSDLQRLLEQELLGNRVTLRLLPPWYVRLGKRLLEWLPRSWADALEARAL